MIKRKKPLQFRVHAWDSNINLRANWYLTAMTAEEAIELARKRLRWEEPVEITRLHHLSETMRAEWPEFRGLTVMAIKA